MRERMILAKLDIVRVLGYLCIGKLFFSMILILLVTEECLHKFIALPFSQFSVYVEYFSGCGCCDFIDKLVVSGECPDTVDTDLCCCD